MKQGQHFIVVNTQAESGVSQHFAVPLQQVVEVVPWDIKQLILNTGEADRAYDEIQWDHGRIPLIDICECIGLGKQADTSNGKLVVVKTATATFAFICTDLWAIPRVSDDDIQPLYLIKSELHANPKLFTGTIPEHTAPVINLEILVTMYGLPATALAE